MPWSWDEYIYILAIRCEIGLEIHFEDKMRQSLFVLTWFAFWVISCLSNLIDDRTLIRQYLETSNMPSIRFCACCYLEVQLDFLSFFCCCFVHSYYGKDWVVSIGLYSSCSELRIISVQHLRTNSCSFGNLVTTNATSSKQIRNLFSFVYSLPNAALSRANDNLRSNLHSTHLK